MAKITNNPLLKGARGMFGNIVVFRELRGKVVMSNRPKKIPITPHQQIMRSRFQRAAQYAKQQMQNPERKAEYAKGINAYKHSAYAVALTDCMTAPKVMAIDSLNYKGATGDVIIVHAVDDFKVVNVQVTIMDSNGKEIEQGNAIPLPDSAETWHYMATQNILSMADACIQATAEDQPGNKGVFQIKIS